jgi:hypothetical protein
MCIKLISLITFSIFLSFLMIACATNSAEENTPSDDSPATGIASSYSLDLVQDVRELVSRAYLVVRVIPVGEVEKVELGVGGLHASYQQDIMVREVLKGQNPGEKIRLVRGGVNTEAKSALREANPDLGIFIEDEEKLGGALTPGDQILFLMLSRTEPVYAVVVGSKQGQFLLNQDGRVIPGNEFTTFDGLTVDEVRNKINDLSR